MSEYFSELSRASRGAWVVHHARKTVNAINGASEFPALDAAGKGAALLSQLASTDQLVVAPARLAALAKVIGLSPKLEVPSLLKMLKDRKIIEQSKDGSVEIVGLTTHATVGHAADLFQDENPSQEEKAAVAIAELTSESPVVGSDLTDFIGDEFRLTSSRTKEFLGRAKIVGFVDAEGDEGSELFFNGNLFRKGNINKAKRVLDSLSSAEATKYTTVSTQLDGMGCMRFTDVEAALGTALFEKLRAASLFDIHHVSNPNGEFGYVTKPSAFHKFNDPVADDAFDLAKALVAALTYGMKDSSSGRGRIDQIVALLGALVAGREIGPATAIEQDYRILETRGVVKTRPGPKYGRFMKLLKRDIGEMALRVLTTGEAATTNVVSRSGLGSMTGYVNPESDRIKLRQRQTPASKRLTHDVLSAVREGDI